jgi:hypothetical protein
MLSKFFEAPARIRAIRRGPSGALLESFANHLFESGYAKVSARQHIRSAEPKLRSGRFRASDKLIASLTTRSFMRRENRSK